jgi:glucan 1,3-beta-glucosidase
MLPLTTLLPALALLLPLAYAAPTETRAVNVGWLYGQQKIRGVNLGGVSGREQ